MRRVVDYKTVAGRESAELEAKVRVLIAEGWEPVGGPVILPATIGAVVVQALVKREVAIIEAHA